MSNTPLLTSKHRFVYPASKRFTIHNSYLGGGAGGLDNLPNEDRSLISNLTNLFERYKTVDQNKLVIRKLRSNFDPSSSGYLGDKIIKEMYKVIPEEIDAIQKLTRTYKVERCAKVLEEHGKFDYSLHRGRKSESSDIGLGDLVHMNSNFCNKKHPSYNKKYHKFIKENYPDILTSKISNPEYREMLLFHIAKTGKIPTKQEHWILSDRMAEKIRGSKISRSPFVVFREYGSIYPPQKKYASKGKTDPHWPTVFQIARLLTKDPETDKTYRQPAELMMHLVKLLKKQKKINFNTGQRKEIVGNTYKGEKGNFSLKVKPTPEDMIVDMFCLETSPYYNKAFTDMLFNEKTWHWMLPSRIFPKNIIQIPKLSAPIIQQWEELEALLKQNKPLEECFFETGSLSLKEISRRINPDSDEDISVYGDKEMVTRHSHSAKLINKIKKRILKNRPTLAEDFKNRTYPNLSFGVSVVKLQKRQASEKKMMELIKSGKHFERLEKTQLAKLLNSDATSKEFKQYVADNYKPTNKWRTPWGDFPTIRNAVDHPEGLIDGRTIRNNCRNKKEGYDVL